MNNRRVVWGLAVGVVSLALVLPMGSAFSCTPAVSTSINPRMGDAGSTATLTGTGFRSVAVEIRWNSPTGTTLAMTQGPNFQESVRIPPDARPGVHYVVAQGGGYRSTSPFEVTAPPEPVTTTTTAPPEAAATTTTASPEGAARTSRPPASGTSGQASTPAPEPSSTQSSASSGPGSPAPDEPAYGPASSDPTPTASVSASGKASSPATARTTVTTRTSVTTGSTDVAAVTDTTLTTAAAAPELPATAVALETPSTTAPERNRQLAAKPAASSGESRPTGAVALVALGGLLSLGGVMFSRWRRSGEGGI